MRIGIDARMYSTTFTGIGRYVYELVKHLTEIDKKNEYVLFMNRPEYDEFKPPNKRVTKVLVKAKHYSFAEQTRYLFKLRGKKLDLMHFTHFNTPILYGGKSVVTIHDLTLSFFPGKKMNSWTHRKAYEMVLHRSVKHASRIIAVSQHTKKDLIAVTQAGSAKIEVIYEGVDEQFKPRPDKEAIRDMIKKYGITKDYILYAGVWRSHKNVVNLIKAFALLREAASFDPQLVITGSDDPHYPEVKRTVRELGLEHDVIFPGLVPEDELVALYQAAHIYSFPSLYEGFGLPPLEAMRCGTPVAASSTSCIPEICGEGNALFFDPLDPEDISNTLLKLWIDEDLRKELRERGLRHSK
ncbi:MAG: glycosyltransferase involved in cell wall biosynthesis, partial [Oceanicoccus sp.]